MGTLARSKNAGYRVFDRLSITRSTSHNGGFIVSWWGIDTFEDNALSKIVKVAEELNFNITIYFESVREMDVMFIADIARKELNTLLVRH
ncbi:MAG: hypothetical protein DRJ66_04270 [Thermoprotei archaeon]|nr:MAG: hypothetical protein DRJ66_04270 [Thermoprotei archaeon]RLF20518.1 MAG: hypothetical protein DRZ82_01880 [Thermoprotei archaeon]